MSEEEEAGKSKVHFGPRARGLEPLDKEMELHCGTMQSYGLYLPLCVVD